MFIRSAVGRGFYPSVLLTWLLDWEAQKVTFQQQEYVSENEKWECFSLSHIWVFLTRGLQPTRLLCPWSSPGVNTGVGRHSLLQGIFLTQGLNPGLPHFCRQILYQLSHQGIFSVYQLLSCLFYLLIKLKL